MLLPWLLIKAKWIWVNLLWLLLLRRWLGCLISIIGVLPIHYLVYDHLLHSLDYTLVALHNLFIDQKCSLGLSFKLRIGYSFPISCKDDASLFAPCHDFKQGVFHFFSFIWLPALLKGFNDVSAKRLRKVGYYFIRLYFQIGLILIDKVLVLSVKRYNQRSKLLVALIQGITNALLLVLAQIVHYKIKHKVLPVEFLKRESHIISFEILFGLWHYFIDVAELVCNAIVWQLGRHVLVSELTYHAGLYWIRPFCVGMSLMIDLLRWCLLLIAVVVLLVWCILVILIVLTTILLLAIGARLLLIVLLMILLLVIVRLMLLLCRLVLVLSVTSVLIIMIHKNKRYLRFIGFLKKLN